MLKKATKMKTLKLTVHHRIEKKISLESVLQKKKSRLASLSETETERMLQNQCPQTVANAKRKSFAFE